MGSKEAPARGCRGKKGGRREADQAENQRGTKEEDASTDSQATAHNVEVKGGTLEDHNYDNKEAQATLPVPAHDQARRSSTA